MMTGASTFSKTEISIYPDGDSDEMVKTETSSKRRIVQLLAGMIIDVHTYVAAGDFRGARSSVHSREPKTRVPEVYTYRYFGSKIFINHSMRNMPGTHCYVPQCINRGNDHIISTIIFKPKTCKTAAIHERQTLIQDTSSNQNAIVHTLYNLSEVLSGLSLESADDS